MLFRKATVSFIFYQSVSFIFISGFIFHQRVDFSLIFKTSTVSVISAVYNRRLLRGEQFIVDKKDNSFKHNLIKAQLFAYQEVESKQIDLEILLHCKGMKNFSSRSTKSWHLINIEDPEQFQVDIEVRVRALTGIFYHNILRVFLKLSTNH